MGCRKHNLSRLKLFPEFGNLSSTDAQVLFSRKFDHTEISSPLLGTYCHTWTPGYLMAFAKSDSLYVALEE
jgi:hypothetical protein